MDIEYILNDCLNKAMCQKGRIQHPNSNNIADFVNNYLGAINYTHCCKCEYVRSKLEKLSMPNVSICLPNEDDKVREFYYDDDSFKKIQGWDRAISWIKTKNKQTKVNKHNIV